MLDVRLGSEYASAGVPQKICFANFCIKTYPMTSIFSKVGDLSCTLQWPRAGCVSAKWHIKTTTFFTEYFQKKIPDIGTQKDDWIN